MPRFPAASHRFSGARRRALGDDDDSAPLRRAAKFRDSVAARRVVRGCLAFACVCLVTVAIFLLTASPLRRHDSPVAVDAAPRRPPPGAQLARPPTPGGAPRSSRFVGDRPGAPYLKGRLTHPSPTSDVAAPQGPEGAAAGGGTFAPHGVTRMKRYRGKKTAGGLRHEGGTLGASAPASGGGGHGHGHHGHGHS